ncbi:putative metalloprotease MEP1 [Paramyrothecium foliicola]|nr:putative metalloprotease MEP1 [Paramyrothecium foliicola]
MIIINMHFKFAAAFLALASSAGAHILPRTAKSQTHAPQLSNSRRCRDTEPSEVQLNQTLNLFRVETAKLAEDSSAYDFQIDVNVFVHVISASSSNYITNKQIKDQIEYLNLAFNPYDVSFHHNHTDFVVNGNWSAGDGELAMKKHLRQGSYKDLNLYYVDRPAIEGQEVLGYCYFPEPGVTEGSEMFLLDGCVVNAQTVPGGRQAPFNLGGTTVHEVGHWFNLFHTFQGGCDNADEVSDTPAQDSPSDGCPKMRDSCPGKPGIDPIHNFMDYSDE